jgi:hypothetical protein
LLKYFAVDAKRLKRMSWRQLIQNLGQEIRTAKVLYRIARAAVRPGQGKSGGFRTLVATNKGSKWFFVFGFPKNVRSNIDKDEEESLKKLASHLLSLSPPALVTAQRAGELMEVNCDAQE